MNETLLNMIKRDPNNLNLIWNERRCILLALITTDFNIKEAWLINAPEIPFVSYKIKLYRHDLKLKDIQMEYFQMTHNGNKSLKK